MNDFDLHYLHYARSEELRKDAENERQARRLLKAAKETRRAGSHVRHAGVAGRVAKALGLRHEEAGRNDRTAVS
ncbi:hypothetical protein SAMN05216298_0162 [Glycomyces sambucus]|uniref:Uncharacterized protein n=1 Tax=Glycomyces sambucus TaxID=380244 RepID=A0A1G9N7C6_9ACTN|nr:hypothetical protein [Glycomyces sambucus]SDL82419.1 hypothetical protein SAMN05216298_0162 [Glycomyces sambucus]